jgi:uncharacterized membrane protein YgcG
MPLPYLRPALLLLICCHLIAKQSTHIICKGSIVTHPRFRTWSTSQPRDGLLGSCATTQLELPFPPFAALALELRGGKPESAPASSPTQSSDDDSSSSDSSAEYLPSRRPAAARRVAIATTPPVAGSGKPRGRPPRSATAQASGDGGGGGGGGGAAGAASSPQDNAPLHGGGGGVSGGGGVGGVAAAAAGQGAWPGHHLPLVRQPSILQGGELRWYQVRDEGT